MAGRLEVPGIFGACPSSPGDFLYEVVAGNEHEVTRRPLVGRKLYGVVTCIGLTTSRDGTDPDLEDGLEVLFGAPGCSAFCASRDLLSHDSWPRRSQSFQ